MVRIRTKDPWSLATLLGAVSGESLVPLKLNTVRSTVVRQTQTNSTLGLLTAYVRLKAFDKLMVRNAWDTRALHDVSSAGLSVTAPCANSWKHTKLSLKAPLMDALLSVVHVRHVRVADDGST